MNQPRPVTTVFEKRTTRYYINLMHPKDERNIATREIHRQEDHDAFDDKIERQDKIVECTINGIVLNALDQNTEAEYNELITAKNTADKLQEENYLLKLKLEAMENKQDNQAEIADIKPLQASEQHVNDQAESVVVENTKLNSVSVNDDKPIDVLDKPKKARRHMKKSTTKKTKLPVKK